jgi:hypothetical protein
LRIRNFWIPAQRRDPDHRHVDGPLPKSGDELTGFYMKCLPPPTNHDSYEVERERDRTLVRDTLATDERIRLAELKSEERVARIKEWGKTIRTVAALAIVAVAAWLLVEKHPHLSLKPFGSVDWKWWLGASTVLAGFVGEVWRRRKAKRPKPDGRRGGESVDVPDVADGMLRSPVKDASEVPGDAADDRIRKNTGGADDGKGHP